jgi:hypothetical protein
MRYLEQELKAAREEIHFLNTRNNSSKIKGQDIQTNLSHWAKLKNSKSRSHRFSADGLLRVQLSSRLSVLEMEQQSTHFLKHVENKVKPLAGKTRTQKRKILLVARSNGS